MHQPKTIHPLGAKAKVLLTSVFGPYAQDDEYGSRKLNPMELYHNQVTRLQGPFSLRMFHRSFGIMMIQANLDAPCTVLDFPTRDRLIEELQQNRYDVIGITSIMANFRKTQHMCDLIREFQPNATIVVGGHVSTLPDVQERLGADHVVKGDGVRWFREFLGHDTEAPIRHPMTLSGFGVRSLGMSGSGKAKDTAALLIPSLGCPVGCNFCATSAMFGGKGHCINFFPTGDALFSVMSQMEDRLGVNSFFAMDENFLLQRKRALRLLELMEQHDKGWAIYIFGSARVLKSYTIEELIGLGISWVWMGLEGQSSQYDKLHGVGTHELIRELEVHGIRVLGSSIIGLEEHTPENIDEAIDWSVSHNTVFHQYMLYTPIPGTPLHKQLESEGRMMREEEMPYADVHGQGRFNYRHKNIPPGDEAEYIIRAFERDFEVNGPSLFRLIRVTLLGYTKYKNHPQPRIRRRFREEGKRLKDTYAAALWAMRKWYSKNPAMRAKIDAVLQDLYQELGFLPQVLSPILGRIIHLALKREAKRYESGWTYEPTTFYIKNASALRLEEQEQPELESPTRENLWVRSEFVEAAE